MTTITISNRNQAEEYPALVPGKTMFVHDGKLYSGLPYMQGHNSGIELTPATPDDVNYLVERHAMPSGAVESVARTRISEMNFTADQIDFIFSDWPNWYEHMEWLLTATRDEIVSWIDAAR